MTINKTAFERWALSQSYDITHAELPSDTRRYANSRTQAAFLYWTAGVASVDLAATATILGTETFIERILAFTIPNSAEAPNE
jgi:hypothetical protein